jgi:hypothetical protein
VHKQDKVRTDIYPHEASKQPNQREEKGNDQSLQPSNQRIKVSSGSTALVQYQRQCGAARRNGPCGHLNPCRQKKVRTSASSGSSSSFLNFQSTKQVQQRTKSAPSMVSKQSQQKEEEGIVNPPTFQTTHQGVLGIHGTSPIPASMWCCPPKRPLRPP